MKAGILVRVVTEIEIMGQRASSLWIVATGDTGEAVKAVRARVTAGCKVEATDHHVSLETILRIGLAPGQAHHM